MTRHEMVALLIEASAEARQPEESEAARWLAVKRRLPLPSGVRGRPNDFVWWLSEDHPDGGRGVPHGAWYIERDCRLSWLPRALFDEMHGLESYRRTVRPRELHFEGERKHQNAVACVVRAWCRLSPEQRAECWAWEAETDG